MRQVALDTETTGLSAAAGHRITEIGCVEIVERQITGRIFQTYVNPERELDEGAQRITGLTLEFLADYPVFSVVVDEFLQFISGAELIIHNAKFDLSFINNELALSSNPYGLLEQLHSIEDTLGLAKKLHPGQRNNLDALCKRYQIDNSKRDKHGALLDSELLAEVYLAMTAGQVSLNLAGEHNAAGAVELNTKENVSNYNPVVRAGNIPIVLASEDELVEHQKYLNLINTSSAGVCLWSNE